MHFPRASVGLKSFVKANMAIFNFLRQSLILLCCSSKCDEQKPNCQKCITHDAECIYAPRPSLKWVLGDKDTPNLSDGKASHHGSDLSPPSYLSNLQTPSISTTNNPSLNLENIDLIINWFTSTVYTVNSPSNLAAIKTCQTLILQQAMEHHFLLHGLLALSALHLANTRPDHKKYTQIATAHHTQGLMLFHSILSEMKDSNYSACIAFSSITAIFAFGSSRPIDGINVGMEIIDDLAQIFLLSKGWTKVVSVANTLDCRAGSSIKAPPTSQASVLCGESEALFKQLVLSNKHQSHDAAEIYSQAISSLEAVFAKVEHGPTDDPHLALEWMESLPDGFVGLMRERQEIALVLLGIYCGVLGRVPQVWWLRGWCSGLFGVVWRGLEPAWKKALEWLRKRIQADLCENEKTH